jgi:ADP-heptose:LPS heptosyltransferase
MNDSDDAGRPAGKRVRRIRRAGARILGAFGRRDGDGRLQLNPASIHHVLVVRASGRMGNTLFLTPLLAAVHEIMPEALIDVLVTYPDAMDLLAGTPGLRRVATLPHKGRWDVLKFSAIIRAHRAHQYDLVIDPTPNSTGGRIMVALSRARWRLGFAGESQWLRLDYAADVARCDRHEALRPLGLLEQAFGYEVVPGRPRLRIASSADELAEGARLLRERLDRAARQAGACSKVIGFFASARGKKDLGPEWWRAFWRAYLELQPDTTPLEVLPAADHPPIDPQFATVHCASPRRLAATISHVDRFFSADTGPMHLASAAGVPTIAFFDRTNPAAFRPIKPEDRVLRINDMTPQDVAASCARIVAAG